MWGKCGWELASVSASIVNQTKEPAVTTQESTIIHRLTPSDVTRHSLFLLFFISATIAAALLHRAPSQIASAKGLLFRSPQQKVSSKGQGKGKGNNACAQQPVEDKFFFAVEADRSASSHRKTGHAQMEGNRGACCRLVSPL